MASLLSSAHYKKRAVIALDADAEQVSIIAMFYVGQDYEQACRATLRMAKSTDAPP